MSDENEMNKKISVEGDLVTLADLAGLELDGFAEKRGEALPKGHYAFECQGGEDMPALKVIGEGEKAKGAAVFKFKVIDVIDTNDPDFTGKEDDLIGKTHQEALFLSDADGLGYLRAFIKDIGGDNTGKLNDALAKCAGLRFIAPIGKRKDKNDTDKVYTNIVRGTKIKPMAASASSSVAAAVA